ncbi:MAG: Tim44 domain-containing protein [Alphaproteobacteria bacterium]|nr:Tim44 domain-containing protein [Alphaproteobacteria bacterium]
MGENFEFFDIILFAMLAVFLVFRLRGVLGKRSGSERRDVNSFARSNDTPDTAQSDAQNDNVIALPDRGAEPPEMESEPDSPLNAGFARIFDADQSFNPGKFAEGAQMAFEMILQAFTDGDGKTLNTLLSSEVYENFAGAIRARELANNTQETTLVGISAADIIDADMDGHDAVVTVKIVSEQINAIRDENGEVIDGDPSEVTTITDIWVFSRDTKSSNPNWVLIATGSPN